MEPLGEEGFEDDEIPVYRERILADETWVRVLVEDITSNRPRPLLLDEMPPWWQRLLDYEPSGGISLQMIRNHKAWDFMQNAVREPGYVSIALPMLYEPSPMKGRHVAHGVRKEAIIEVIRDMGMDVFARLIDREIKSGETIEWDDPDREDEAPRVTEYVDDETKFNYYVRLRLPTDVEQEVARRSEDIAEGREGKRVKAKVDEAFNSYQELNSMRQKSHDGAVKHGFPSYAQRWFERPIYRYQQTMLGLGPLFVGGRHAGEPSDLTHINKAWMVEMLSPDGRQAAENYLEIMRNWDKNSIQGKPIAPIGVSASQFRQEDRYKMFMNSSGLVPTHLPWVIRDAVSWMSRNPCASNFVPLTTQDSVDHYGRQLKEGTMNMKFYYLAEGREIGEMAYQDFWFEKREVPDPLGFGRTKSADVMVTTLTAKRASDPYNGTGVVEQPTNDWIR
eukprot:3370087-Amphidinium_carterae.1